ncbi:hypothetical protein N7450_011463 [Penicillium hetheringtonii]|uniref:ER-bound oxygenase mpaB/mpaB'/Rubber oxygenase catalytic domain-containing protein n=1 Tax=Penicillium hetheringtonii TaxID=911720 RepID=A0AAD6D9Z8_9EURO|nr:hypothetical protein N7450_011463 [Penicillium hetheringtonii]
MFNMTELHQSTWNLIFVIVAAILISYIARVKRLRYQCRAKIEAHLGLARGICLKHIQSLPNYKSLNFLMPFPRYGEWPYSRPEVSQLCPSFLRSQDRILKGMRGKDPSILRFFYPRDSDRYMTAVARMNYLYAMILIGCANKITDQDFLHTLRGWSRRDPQHVEKCALGIFHKNLGEDMGIPFDPLPSQAEGWKDGLHFGLELQEWTVGYEEEVAKPTATNDQYVRIYVDSALSSLPSFARSLVRQMLGADLDNVMRTSLCVESPSIPFSLVLSLIRYLRKLLLRNLTLPRSDSAAVKLVHEMPNPEPNLYNFEEKGLQPWYIKPTFWSKWGPGSFIVRVFGGKVPGSRGDRYQPRGYDLMTIGPDPQKGRGMEEMKSDIEEIRARSIATCPFSQAKAGELKGDF